MKGLKKSWLYKITHSFFKIQIVHPLQTLKQKALRERERLDHGGTMEMPRHTHSGLHKSSLDCSVPDKQSDILLLAFQKILV